MVLSFCSRKSAQKGVKINPVCNPKVRRWSERFFASYAISYVIRNSRKLCLVSKNYSENISPQFVVSEITQEWSKTMIIWIVSAFSVAERFWRQKICADRYLSGNRRCSYSTGHHDIYGPGQENNATWIKKNYRTTRTGINQFTPWCLVAKIPKSCRRKGLEMHFAPLL